MVDGGLGLDDQRFSVPVNARDRNIRVNLVRLGIESDGIEIS